MPSRKKIDAKEGHVGEVAYAIGKALGIDYEGEQLPFTIHTRDHLAKELVDAGYGNVENAVKAFAEELRDSIHNKMVEMQQIKSDNLLSGASNAGIIAGLVYCMDLIYEMLGKEN